MLCKKCNEVVQASEDVCKACGTPVFEAHNIKRRPRVLRYIVVVAVLIASGAFVYLYMQDMINFDFFGGSAQADVEIPGTDDDFFVEQTQESDPEAEGAVSTVRDQATRQALLADVHAAAFSYVTQLSLAVPFISYGGYLFNQADGVFITAQVLAGIYTLELTEEHLEEEKLVLFLRPSDLAVFDEVNLPDTSQMTIFVGLETVTGVGLFSVFGYTEIFRENLNAVISSYLPLEGDALRPQALDAVFAATRAAVSQQESSSFDVRYLAHDDNFVFVTVSTRGQSHILRHHIFLRGAAGLTHLLSDFESARHPHVAINQAIPNFNFALLPEFILSQTHLIEVDEYGVFDHHFDPLLPPLFASAAASPAVALVILPDVWQVMRPMGDGMFVQEFYSWQETEAFLIQSGFPLYILRQE